jgi:putative toxin-antitoxin system antitoxin component (TIGR02293 family)
MVRQTPSQSDRVVRIDRLTDMVRALMRGDEEATRRWLNTPQAPLGDETPLHRASTEAGEREVEQLIGRIRHGVFS